MKRSMLRLIPLAVVALAFVGCTSPEIRPEADAAPVVEDGSMEQVQGRVDVGGEGTDAETAGMQGGGEFSATPWEDPQNPLYNKVIYFDYDRSEIRPEHRDIVITHGQYLASNPTIMVTVEGHCDERGSREYNIGLGERRANAVKQLLMAQGASATQITTVSYGEERPEAMGSDESAWALNRRALLAY